MTETLSNPFHVREFRAKEFLWLLRKFFIVTQVFGQCYVSHSNKRILFNLVRKYIHKLKFENLIELYFFLKRDRNQKRNKRRKLIMQGDSRIFSFVNNSRFKPRYMIVVAGKS